MTTILRGACGLALMAIAAMPAALSAQSPLTSPVHFGVDAGATIPLGDFGTATDVGYHLGGLLEFAFSGSPLGIRIDGQWHRNAIKESGGISGNNDIFLGAASLVVQPSTSSGMVVPYALGGVGIYHNNFGLDIGSTSETNAGFNIGAGIKFKLTGFASFLEARYHYVSSSSGYGSSGGSTSFFPLTFGIIF